MHKNLIKEISLDAMKTYINCRQDMGSYTVCLFYSTIWLHEAIYFIKSILKITILTQKNIYIYIYIVRRCRAAKGLSFFHVYIFWCIIKYYDILKPNTGIINKIIDNLRWKEVNALLIFLNYLSLKKNAAFNVDWQANVWNMNGFIFSAIIIF